MEFIDGLRETWSNPNMRHAAVVHLPVALGVACLIMSVICAVNRGRNATLRWMAAAMFAALLAAAWTATQSGAAAEDALKRDLVAQARDLIHEHEEMGEKVWLFALGGLAAIAVAAVRRPAVRLTALWIGAIIGLATAGWIGATAHHGGAAVYRHGTGTASYQAAAAPQPPSGTATPSPGTVSGDPRLAFFHEKVEPIIEQRCLRCHNQSKHKGGLVQTTVASLLKGGKSGPAVIPGRPEVSPMFMKITHRDDEQVMPPDGRLSDDEIRAVETWIRDGAVGQ